MNHDATATQLPAVPSDSADSRLPAIPLNEESPPLPRGVVSVDLVLCGLTLILAGLLASVPARSSDVWLHLAAGRGLFDGTYRFGTDPFSHTSAGTFWVNHDWLYDVLTLGLFRAVGGSGLVIAKSLLAVALAFVLVRMGRAGRALWMPAVGATLTVLVIGPRLFLNPMMAS